MKLFYKNVAVLVILALLPCFATAGEIVEKVSFKKPFPGSKERQYLLFLPDGYSTDITLPLVVILHGCKQTHWDIMHATRFNDLAEAENFIAVYPFITSYEGFRDTNCWGFWREDEIHQGAGEVADIAAIITETQATYSIDPDRIHITGLSSGGAMATAVMVAYSEIIASGAPAAAIAYGETACAVRGVCSSFRWLDPTTWFDWYAPVFEAKEETVSNMVSEMGEEKRLVPILALHSTNDTKVDITAALNNVNAWAELFNIDMTRPVTTETGQTDTRNWRHNGYGSSASATAIETHFVDGPSHAWVGGASGSYADPDGPDWAAAAWDFFKNHPMVGE